MAPSLLSSSRAHDGTVELTAAGAWTSPDAAELERLVQGIAAKSEASSTAIDMRGVEQFDTAVDQRTPIRIDTVVSMDFLGLTGSPVISLIGGKSERPLVGENGYMPILVADAAASQSMSQAARDVLRRFEELLAENAQPLRGLIGNLDTFAGALARNSDHLDGIVAGLERMTGGAAAKARLVTYDLTVPHAGEDIRKFQLAANGNADVEFGCKIVEWPNHRHARVSGCLCGRAANTPAAVAALDRAFGQAGSDLGTCGQ